MSIDLCAAASTPKGRRQIAGKEAGVVDPDLEGEGEAVLGMEVDDVPASAPVADVSA